MNKWTELMLKGVGLGLVILGFILCWKGALLVFIGYWIDNVRKEYRKEDKKRS